MYLFFSLRFQLVNICFNSQHITKQEHPNIFKVIFCDYKDTNDFRLMKCPFMVLYSGFWNRTYLNWSSQVILAVQHAHPYPHIRSFYFFTFYVTRTWHKLNSIHQVLACQQLARFLYKVNGALATSSGIRCRSGVGIFQISININFYTFYLSWKNK